MPRSKPSPQALRSTLRLHDVARHVIVPDGIVSTAYPGVKAFLDSIGIFFDSWQQGLAQLILAEDETGCYAATVGGVVLSIARQTGKTYVVRWVIFALCCLVPGTKVVWTSHHGQTTDLTLEEFDQMSQSPAAAPFVEHVTKARGNEAIRFTNGSIIRFGARERGFGRGHDKVTILVFDEAQIMTDRGLQNMIPAQNAGDNPLFLLMGTPPTPHDPSEVFSEKRRRALAGSGNSVYVEISCDPVPANKDPQDWIRNPAQWGKGNPAYLTGRTNENSMLRMIENLTLNGPEGMLREGLGLWDAETKQKEAIPWQAWAAQLVTVPLEPEQRIVSDVTVCLAATRNRQWVYVSRCGERADGLAQVELIAKLPSDDVQDWLMAHRRWIREVTGQARGAGKTSEIITALQGDPTFKIRVTPWQGADLTGAYGRGMDALTTGVVATMQHPDLDFCVPRVVWKDLGGGQVIDGAKSKTEMAPLMAWFGAYGMRTRVPDKPKRQQIRISPTVVKR